MRLEGARAVLFDKDGTLFDFNRSWSAFGVAIVEHVAAGDRARAEQMAEIAGLDLETGRYTPGSVLVAGAVREIAETWAPLAPGWSADALVDLMDGRGAVAPVIEMAPATSDLLGDLRRLRAGGLALGVATNDSEAPARAQLRHAGIADCFDFIAGYDSGFGAKPGPGMVRAFADAVGAPLNSIVMVGDSPHDLRAGKAAGALASVGVLTGPAPRSFLEADATVILDTIADLHSLLGV